MSVGQNKNNIKTQNKKGSISNALNVIFYGFPFIGFGLGGVISIVQYSFLPTFSLFLASTLFILTLLAISYNWIVKQDSTIYLVAGLLLIPFSLGVFLTSKILNHSTFFGYLMTLSSFIIFALIYIQNKWNQTS